MGQLTIYLPDAIERRFRRSAKRVRKSMSAYIASLAGDASPRDLRGYTDDFKSLFGSLKGLLNIPADPPVEAPRFVLEILAGHGHVRRVPGRRRRSSS